MTYPTSLDELTDGVPSDGAAPTTELDDATYPHDDHHRELAQTLEGVESVLGYGGMMPGDLLFPDLLGQGVGMVGFPFAGVRFGMDGQTGDVGLYGLNGSAGSAFEIFGADDSCTVRGVGGVFIDGPGTAAVGMNLTRTNLVGPTLELKSWDSIINVQTARLTNVVDPSGAQDAATKNSQDAAVAAEATLARNADNLTSGTVADARIPSGIARDSEVAAAVSAHESDTTSVHGITDTSALALTTNVVTKALVDAKGDLLVGTANDTVARKAAGTNGYVLVAQSGASDGLTWQAQSGLVVNTVAAAGSTETLDGDDFNIHDITLDENITFTFTTTAAVAQFTLILRQDGSGTNTVTWPASVKWNAATAPTILTTASAVHVLEFLTVDTGTTWRGFLASSNVS